ncbi:MAG: hypothetical protein RIR00_731 [Pseudomonadota bacterium]
MKQGTPTRQRLVALGLLGGVLLTPPLLGTAQGELGGWPAFFVYLFVVWGGLIALAARIAGKGRL